MNLSNNRHFTLDEILDRSRSADALVRDDAIYRLADFISDERAITRLYEMLDDESVTMRIDAAEVLAKHGGADGLLLVMEKLGERSSDPDADYIAYKLYELDASGEIEVVDTIESTKGELSVIGSTAFENFKVLRFGGGQGNKQ